jgi:hypothetical protein
VTPVGVTRRRSESLYGDVTVVIQGLLYMGVVAVLLSPVKEFVTVVVRGLLVWSFFLWVSLKLECG